MSTDARRANIAWFEHGDALNCVVDLPGDTNGFHRRVQRMEGIDVICVMFASRWHGFARYEVQRRFLGDSNASIVERLESGWIWRGRHAPYYEFGPTNVEIHGTTLIDNRGNRPAQ